MVERPILMSGPLVLQTLADLKNQTRRTRGLERINNDPGGSFLAGVGDGVAIFGCSIPADDPLPIEVKCPYGKPGDRLWVRETWYCDHTFAGDHVGTCSGCVRCTHTDADRIAEWRELLEYRADHDCRSWEAGCPCTEGEWRPSIHMPRWASRLTLEITQLRVERLQAISEEDAKAEGVSLDSARWSEGFVEGHREQFARLWDSINGAREPRHIKRRSKRGKRTDRYEATHPKKTAPYSWAANPWVWVVGFKRVEAARG
jgi:hypothetical protein